MKTETFKHDTQMHIFGSAGHNEVGDTRTHSENGRRCTLSVGSTEVKPPRVRGGSVEREPMRNLDAGKPTNVLIHMFITNLSEPISEIRSHLHVY
jgi:hypothetical protein